MPQPVTIFDDGLARRESRGVSHGITAWDFLHRLLLGANAAFICAGRHESFVDHGVEYFCFTGKDVPEKNDGQLGLGDFIDRMGDIDPLPGYSLNPIIKNNYSLLKGENTFIILMNLEV